MRCKRSEHTGFGPGLGDLLGSSRGRPRTASRSLDEPQYKTLEVLVSEDLLLLQDGKNTVPDGVLVLSENTVWDGLPKTRLG
jgi:hypothetical protein